MVFRNKDLTKPPAGLTDPKWDQLKQQALVEKNDHEARTACYRDETLNELCILYKHKCAICERLRGTELEVDHFRPKKARQARSEPAYNHHGYYWLSYVWFNLIPTCSKCNGKKSNKFLIAGQEVTEHDIVNGFNPFEPFDREWLDQIEQPQIVNPEVEKIPANHFRYNNNGTVSGKSNQGETTIDVYKLNRENLVRERLKVLKEYWSDISECFNDYLSNNNPDELRGGLRTIFRKIVAGSSSDSAFSLLHICVYKRFDVFIIDRLPTSIRQKTLAYWEQYLNQFE